LIWRRLGVTFELLERRTQRAKICRDRYHESSAKELRLVGAYVYLDHEFKAAISLIADERVNVKAMISDALPLHRIAEGFEAMARGDESDSDSRLS
jgi:threonine dehydrogenase-like Zn-dependent dehydrogenase